MPDQDRSIKLAPPRGIGRSLLLTLPVALFTVLLFTPVLRQPGRPAKIAALIAWSFMLVLFFLMIRSRETYRWRRVFFISLGFLFPVGFIWDLITLRSSMSIPIERMVSGDTPFCFMVIPMLLIPAALTKTLIFPGSILPTASNPHSIAMMVALWVLATVVLGKAWCSYGCFFGGLDEGFSSIAKKARLRKINPKLRLVPWAILVTIVLLSAATYEPIPKSARKGGSGDVGAMWGAQGGGGVGFRNPAGGARRAREAPCR
ncbi:MAG: 4Fe-4S binding protein, partial [Terriglobia bacterium]